MTFSLIPHWSRRYFALLLACCAFLLVSCLVYLRSPHMGHNFWRTVNLKKLEIPEEILSNVKVTSVGADTVNVNGITVFYRESVPKELKSEITLVLLHGQSFTSETWLKLGTIQTIGASGFRVLAVDLPGYGKSPAAKIDDKGLFLKNLLDIFKVTKPVIVSPSMSGIFSLPFMLKYSNQVAGFVPVAPVTRDLEKLAQTKDNNTVVKDVYEPLQKFLHEPIYDLSHIKTPTLVVFGEKDRSRSSALMCLLPHSQCQEIPKAGHPAYLDNPELWHQLLYNFLHHVSNRNISA